MVYFGKTNVMLFEDRLFLGDRKTWKRLENVSWAFKIQDNGGLLVFSFSSCAKPSLNYAGKLKSDNNADKPTRRSQRTAFLADAPKWSWHSFDHYVENIPCVHMLQMFIEVPYDNLTHAQITGWCILTMELNLCASTRLWFIYKITQFFLKKANLKPSVYWT